MRSNIVKIRFLSHQKLGSLQDPNFQSRSTPPNEVQALPRALIPLVETEISPKTQTLDYK